VEDFDSVFLISTNQVRSGSKRRVAIHASEIHRETIRSCLMILRVISEKLVVFFSLERDLGGR
jgi:hypothetical protein